MAAPIPDEWRYRIKSATRDLTDRCGGVERCAALCGVAASTVSRWRVAGGEDDPIIPIAAALRPGDGSRLGAQGLGVRR